MFRGLRKRPNLMGRLEWEPMVLLLVFSLVETIVGIIRASVAGGLRPICGVGLRSIRFESVHRRQIRCKLRDRVLYRFRGQFSSHLGAVDQLGVVMVWVMGRGASNTKVRQPALVYDARLRDERDAPNVITDTLLIFYVPYTAFIDISSTHSYVACSISGNLGIPVESTSSEISVLSLLGQSIRVNKLYRDVPLMVQEVVFLENLMELLFREFNLILGMDWLVEHRLFCQGYLNSEGFLDVQLRSLSLPTEWHRRSLQNLRLNFKNFWTVVSSVLVCLHGGQWFHLLKNKDGTMRICIDYR
ncbi:Iota-carrageenase [Gossypium australe]|uniref:Iota-carrageenase n=1 Tax=Gossypium australe TaxID=47621 RepID=A0A5B6VVD6_9ROSI|nr:Iota-carrageenase [Gossypium australe]